jgi:hypothetical protein
MNGRGQSDLGMPIESSDGLGIAGQSTTTRLPTRTRNPPQTPTNGSTLGRLTRKFQDGGRDRHDSSAKRFGLFPFDLLAWSSPADSTVLFWDLRLASKSGSATKTLHGVGAECRLWKEEYYVD